MSGEKLDVSGGDFDEPADQDMLQSEEGNRGTLQSEEGNRDTQKSKEKEREDDDHSSF